MELGTPFCSVFLSVCGYVSGISAAISGRWAAGSRQTATMGSVGPPCPSGACWNACKMSSCSVNVLQRFLGRGRWIIGAAAVLTPSVRIHRARREMACVLTFLPKLCSPCSGSARSVARSGFAVRRVVVPQEEAS
ncbi:uncharacterized protein IWZ02DRAFT_237639 [Phyllosticta citriasiana]|uniref:uncharacterized protein n=1 Tax=Phyllosticta citriasiana TaxID=595635 RepID=UPI0030FD8D10